ncbi:MAG: hypothetical protein ACFB50_07530 [Rubrobacteraceae bacterium]
MQVDNTDRPEKAAENLVDVSRESYRSVVERTFAAREYSTRVTRSFFEDVVEEVHRQTVSNLRATEELSGQMRRQREALRELSEASLDLYGGVLDSLETRYGDMPEKEDS